MQRKMTFQSHDSTKETKFPGSRNPVKVKEIINAQARLLHLH